MANLARILRILAVALIALGFFGPPGLRQLGVFGGIVLLFVARAVGRQTPPRRRQRRRKSRETADEHEEPETSPRMRGHERTRHPGVTPEAPKTGPVPKSPEVVAEALEDITAIQETADKQVEDLPETPDLTESDERLSSAEMIAQARKRWDRKP